MTEPQDRPCSLFQSANRSRYPQGDPVPLSAALDRIRDESDTGPGTIEYRRLLATEGEGPAKEWRRGNAPAATLSARFYGPRDLDGKWGHTGAVVLDYDHIPRDRVESLKAAAADVKAQGAAAPHAIAVFASHGGEGVKVVVHVSPVPRTWEQHAEAWEAARALYDRALGAAADQLADATRLTFLPYDEAAIIRAAGETHALRMQYEAPNPPKRQYSPDPAPAPAPADSGAPPADRRCTKCGHPEREHYLRRVPPAWVQDYPGQPERDLYRTRGVWRICRTSAVGGRPALCFEVPDLIDMRTAWEGAMT